VESYNNSNTTVANVSYLEIKDHKVSMVNLTRLVMEVKEETMVESYLEQRVDFLEATLSSMPQSRHFEYRRSLFAYQAYQGTPR
jgi:hypothetical protein